MPRRGAPGAPVPFTQLIARDDLSPDIKNEDARVAFGLRPTSQKKFVGVVRGIEVIGDIHKDATMNEEVV